MLAMFLSIQLSSHTIANENDTFKLLRNKAIADLNTSNKNRALKALNNLSVRGDNISSRVLGAIYLHNNIVKASPPTSEKYFLQAAKRCDELAISFLIKNFYNKRGSEFFNPLKGVNLNKVCERGSEGYKNNQKAEQKRKNEELAKAEQKRKNEELAKAEQKRKNEELAKAEQKRKNEELVKAEQKRKNEELAKAEQKRKNEELVKAEQKRKNEELVKAEQKRKNESLINDSVIENWAKVIPLIETEKSSGSSVAITPDGMFLTNYHVIDTCTNVAVVYNNMKGKVKIINYDKELDVALLKIKAPTPYFAQFDVSDLSVGEWLFALGYPVKAIFGDGPSFSDGHLTNTSDLRNSINDGGFLLVSIPIASGNSGGPIFNKYGGLRGIVSYAIDSKNYQEWLKTEKDVSITLSSTNLNFAVSGIRIFQWLENLNIFLESTKNNMVGDKDTIVKQGLKTLARVICY